MSPCWIKDINGVFNDLWHKRLTTSHDARLTWLLITTTRIWKVEPLANGWHGRKNRKCGINIIDGLTSVVMSSAHGRSICAHEWQAVWSPVHWTTRRGRTKSGIINCWNNRRRTTLTRYLRGEIVGAVIRVIIASKIYESFVRSVQQVERWWCFLSSGIYRFTVNRW